MCVGSMLTTIWIFTAWKWGTPAVRHADSYPVIYICTSHERNFIYLINKSIVFLIVYCRPYFCAVIKTIWTKHFHAISFQRLMQPFMKAWLSLKANCHSDTTCQVNKQSGVHSCRTWQKVTLGLQRYTGKENTHGKGLSYRVVMDLCSNMLYKNLPSLFWQLWYKRGIVEGLIHEIF